MFWTVLELDGVVAVMVFPAHVQNAVFSSGRLVVVTLFPLSADITMCEDIVDHMLVLVELTEAIWYLLRGTVNAYADRVLVFTWQWMLDVGCSDNGIVIWVRGVEFWFYLGCDLF